MEIPLNHLVEVFWQRVFYNDREPAMRVIGIDGPDNIEPLSWGEVGLGVAMIMSFLRTQGVKRGDRVAILGWNSPEWVWSDFALQTMGAIVVPIYPNNSPEQVADILADAGVEVAITVDRHQLEKLPKGIKAVTLDAADSTGALFHQLFIRKVSDRLGTHPYACFPANGAANELDALRNACCKADFLGLSDDDIATLIYTSGSTGTPKGCKISHGNIIGVLNSLASEEDLRRGTRDRYLSYLPLAHVFERFNGVAVAMYQAVPVSFCAVDQVQSGFRLYRPTMAVGVPAVWRKIRDSVYAGNEGPAKLLSRVGLWKPFVDWAVSTEKGSLGFRLADRVLFSKVRAKLGGSLNLTVSGGAPTSVEMIRFYKQIGLELLEGYGATETTGGIAINRPGKVRPGSVGQLLTGTEARIRFEDGETEFGELELRGKTIFKGYWNKPVETAEALTEDGWYRTGDLARLEEVPGEQPYLFVIGRKNGMYKTEGGKFVPKEKVEKAFETETIVHYVVPVAHGRKFATALIFVNLVAARSLVRRPVPEGVDAVTFYSEQPEVADAVKAAVAAANAKLERWEEVKKYVILPVEAQVANGLLTPTLKMRTNEAFKRFKSVIDGMYTGEMPVASASSLSRWQRALASVQSMVGWN